MAEKTLLDRFLELKRRMEQREHEVRYPVHMLAGDTVILPDGTRHMLRKSATFNSEEDVRRAIDAAEEG